MLTLRQSQILNTFTNHGWSLKRKLDNAVPIKSVAGINCANLPQSFVGFLEHIDFCANADDTAWFLTEDDYNGATEASFAWNEFEIISIEAADGDPDLLRSINHFWRQHIPILLSVKSGYAFIAISLAKNDYGRIVTGHEPEFEDVSEICSSFDELLDLIEAMFSNMNGSTLSKLL